MTLSLDTAYRSFGGEVEASSTPTICRLPDSRRHQLWAIAPRQVAEKPAAESQTSTAGDLDGRNQDCCRTGVRRLHRELHAEIREGRRLPEQGSRHAACFLRLPGRALETFTDH